MPSLAVELIKQPDRYPSDLLPFAGSDPEREAGRWLSGLAAVDVSYGASELPKLLADRAHTLPPEQIDLVLLYAAMRGLLDSGPDSASRVLEDWSLLSQSQNPVYRFLALRGTANAVARAQLSISREDSAHNARTAPARFEFIKPFLSDSDPVIVAEALRRLGSVASQDAKLELESFRNLQQKAGNLTLGNLAQDALQTCNALLSFSAK